MNFDNKIENQLQNYLCMHGILSNQTTWHAQTGGRTNKVWRLEGETDLICKLYLETKTNPLFNNTPEAEYRCLLWLDGSDIAPKPYKYLKTPFGAVLMYFYIKGETWSHNVDTVSELLTRIRKYQYPKGLRILSNFPSDIKQTGLEIINKLNRYYQNELINICPDVSISDIEPVFLHTDVVPGNLILGDNGLRLIDWQCPAIGDPIIDIMMFLSPGMHEIYGSGKLSMKDHHTFLMNLTPQLRSRYNILGPLYHWRLAAYCFWKAEQGFIEYEKAALAEIDLLKMI
ncbi:aminoglycoside phosphotransferase family protein [Amylibacter sp.]|jgi:thiamine kinase|nr:aminoglycoside phosphotransferase family protein [Amylibacter sp.]